MKKRKKEWKKKNRTDKQSDDAEARYFKMLACTPENTLLKGYFADQEKTV